MTTEILYERYKDALRRGHVAALRGRTDEAIGAYAEAISLAPDRPLAHISRAGVLAKVGRFDDALAGYERALRLAPREVAALGGRAEALARLGRRTEAAEAFDLLADVHEAAGRTAEACDTARSALEQAESKARRRHIADLTIKLSEAVGDQAAEQALARALHVLEGAAPTVSRTPRPFPPRPRRPPTPRTGRRHPRPSRSRRPTSSSSPWRRRRPWTWATSPRPATASCRSRPPTRRPVGTRPPSTPATEPWPSRRRTRTCTWPSSTCTWPVAGGPWRPTSCSSSTN